MLVVANQRMQVLAGNKIVEFYCLILKKDLFAICRSIDCNHKDSFVV